METSAQVNVGHQSKPSEPPHRIESEAAWQASDLAKLHWSKAVDSATMAELDRIAAWVDENPDVDPQSLDPGQFDCPALAQSMANIQATLTDGFGFVLLTGLPFDRWNERTARAISWLLCHFVAPPVMQKWTGTRVYDVRDTGAQLAHGVRRSLTNLKQDLHTDGPWLPTTADYMALACIRQADAGGVSRISSLVAAHNWFSPRTSPAPRAVVCRVLVGPPGRTWRRRASGKLSSGLQLGRRRLRVRYYDDYIRNGYRLMQESLDALGSDALAAMRDFVEAPENCFEFRLDRGQIFFLNNHLVAHGRSAFVDAPSTDRLLLRFWLRPHGGVAFEV